MESTEATRPLLEAGAEVFIRSNRALPILRKIMAVETGSNSLSLPDEKHFDKQVSSQKPFGLRTFFRGAQKMSSKMMCLSSKVEAVDGRAGPQLQPVKA